MPNTTYTEEQIRTALTETVHELGDFDLHVMGRTHSPDLWGPGEISVAKTLLKHLNDAEEGRQWQRCSFNEIRKGDRVRVVKENFYTEFNHPVLEVGQHSMFGSLLFACGTREHLDDYKALYRIPAPAQHPDPQEHRLIVDGEGNLYQSSGGHYMRPGPFGAVIEFHPNEITDWAPAKVILDEDH